VFNIDLFWRCGQTSKKQVSAITPLGFWGYFGGTLYFRHQKSCLFS